MLRVPLVEMSSRSRGFAERAGFQDRLHQPHHRIAAVVLVHGEHTPGPLGGGHDLEPGADRQRDRLLDPHVDARVERLDRQRVMGPRVGHDVDRVGPLAVEQLAEVGVDGGAGGERLLCLVRNVLGGGAVGVAERDEIERAEDAAVLDLTVQVTQAHAAATDLRYANTGHLVLLCLAASCVGELRIARP